MTGGFLASALRGAIKRFEEPLELVRVTVSKSRGHTTREEEEPVEFFGSIADADVWRAAIAAGGEMSSTSPVLVVADNALITKEDPDDEDVAVALGVNDIVVNRAGVRLKIVKRVNASPEFGVVLYQLTEEL